MRNSKVVGEKKSHVTLQSSYVRLYICVKLVKNLIDVLNVCFENIQWSFCIMNNLVTIGPSHKNGDIG